jgi:hypothetical protein
MEIDMLYMTDNIFVATPEDVPKTPRRRESAIEDGRLWSDRDHLVWLFEVTWADVGRELSRIKTPADVSTVLQVWKGRSSNFIVETLLRPESSPATAKILNVQRRQLRDLIVSTRQAWEYREKCRASLEVAERAFSPELSEHDKGVVEEQRKKRTEKFVQADAEYEAAKSLEAKLDKAVKEGETHFARTEFVQFCQSKRYRLTPLNSANALAGIPLIGWRQSVQRCTKEQAKGANGGAIQIFDAIRRIVDSCTRKSLMTKHAEQWLRSHGTKSYGVTELRKDFYFLRSAIETVLKLNPRRHDLPYSIAREYWKRKNHLSNVDILFAEDEAL